MISDKVVYQRCDWLHTICLSMIICPAWQQPITERAEMEIEKNVYFLAVTHHQASLRNCGDVNKLSRLFLS